MDDILEHYGTPRHSGRYAWGSGKDPQRSHDFLSKVDAMRAKGIKDVDIAAELGITTTKMRSNIAVANQERKTAMIETAKHMQEDGNSISEISARLGIASNSVRTYLNTDLESDKVQRKQIDNIKDAVMSGVEKTGYLDVGPGIAQQLGISRDKLQKTVKALEDEGYTTHDVYVKRLTDNDKYTTIHVLSKEKDINVVKQHKDDIATLEQRTDDGGTTFKQFKKPETLELSKVGIRYGDEGGEDRDGLIQVRPGAKGLDLGNAKYAQVRIAIGDGLYAKGMAIIDNDAKFPPGKDIIFNTNKTRIDPVTGVATRTDKVFKKIKSNEPDPMKMFGTTITDQKGKLNIASQEGDWNTWSSTLSSQFLSKQPISLVRDRLDATHDGLKKQFDEAMSIPNPVLRKQLLDGIVSDAQAKQVHLKAQGLPKSKSHVLLPFPDISPGQVYAPNYRDGDKVVLVRYPHGGRFELPELTVNNKLRTPKKVLGNVPDAIGIHPSVAHKLSGADFDGDTVMVIPNNQRKIKTADSLKGLKNFDPNQYEVDHATITPRYKQTQMGIVSNLITDMTIKGAGPDELARAVRHSMVVIDSEKHKLNYKQSAIDNGITALQKKYQSHVDPFTGKASTGSSTIVSQSKGTVNKLVQGKAKNGLIKVSDLKSSGHYNVVGKALIEKANNRSVKTVDEAYKKYTDVDGYLEYKKIPSIPVMNLIDTPTRLSSGTRVESEYAAYVSRMKGLANEATKASMATPAFRRDPVAAKKYAPLVESLRGKVQKAAANAPRERQAQAQAEKLYRERSTEDMTADARKKLKTQVLNEARDSTGAHRVVVDVTKDEWKAIDNEAISANLLKDVIRYADLDKLVALAKPRVPKLTDARVSRAQSLLANGYTYAQVADSLGVSVSTIKREVN